MPMRIDARHVTRFFLMVDRVASGKDDSKWEMETQWTWKLESALILCVW